MKKVAPTRSKADQTAYEQTGGERAVRMHCTRLYELVDELPDAKACRNVYPPSLQRAEKKFFEFMSGRLGGSQLYRQKYGHPRLRRRHFSAPIGDEKTSGWLACFHEAWTEIVPASPLADRLASRIDALGWHMRNTPREVDVVYPYAGRQTPSNNHIACTQ